MIEQNHLEILIPELPVVSTAVKQAMLMPTFNPTGTEIQNLLKAIRPGLAKMLGTNQTICLIPASKNYVWTSLLAALKNRRVLHFVTGPESERRLNANKVFNDDTLSVKIPFGAVVSAQGAESIVTQAGDLAAVCLSHVDTASTAMNPLREIALNVKTANPACMVLVDGCHAAGQTELHFDRDRLDAYIFEASTLGMPTGLTIAALSTKLLDKLESAETSWDLLDVPAHADLSSQPQILEAFPQQLLLALAACLQLIEAETLAVRISRHWRLAARVRAFAQEFFEQASAPGFAAYGMTAVKTPPEFSLEEFHRRLLHSGIRVGGSLNKEPVFRIAHTGQLSLEQLETRLSVIAEVAHELIPESAKKQESAESES